MANTDLMTTVNGDEPHSMQAPNAAAATSALTSPRAEPHWGRWFGGGAARPDTPIRPQPKDDLGLTRDYERLVRECCARYGIGQHQLRAEAISVGADGGKQVYVVLVTGADEDLASVIRTQLIAPVIERRVAESVSASWIGDVSKFAGVWTRWPPQLRVPDPVRALFHDLRQQTTA